MSPSIGDDDLLALSSALDVPLDAFVHYGQTVILRPGATTIAGRVLSGVDVQRALATAAPSTYAVFPLAVAYGPGDAEAGVDVDLAARLGADLGATTVQVVGQRRRYANVAARFRASVAALRARRSPGRVRAAKSMLRVLGRSWAHMKKKGIARGGLPSPRRLRQELEALRVVPQTPRLVARPLPPVRTAYPQVLPARPRLPRGPFVQVLRVSPVEPPPPTPPTSTYTPVSRRVSEELYHRDQAALEEEVAETTPSYLGAVPRSRAGFTPAFRRRAARLRRFSPPSPMYPSSAYRHGFAEFDDSEALEDEARASMPRYYGGVDYAVGQEELAADLRAETVGYLFGALEHDYFGGSTLSELASSMDVVVDMPDFDADFGDESGVDADLLASLASISPDMEPGALVQAATIATRSARCRARSALLESSAPNDARRWLRRADRWASTLHQALGATGGGTIEGLDDEDDLDSDATRATVDVDRTLAIPGRAKAVNRARRAIVSTLPEVVDQADRVAQILARLTETLRVASPRGSVNYARLRPRPPGASGEPIVVIGIQRTASPLDVLRTVLEEAPEVRVPRSYDAADAVAAMRARTRVSDFEGEASLGGDDLLFALIAPMSDAEAAVHGPVLYGGANAAAWPDGDGAPLPPPRRLGDEVYGG